MDIEFVATVAVIAPIRCAVALCASMPSDCRWSARERGTRTARKSGCKSFGIWPLSQAAHACFGSDRWPAERPVPQVNIEIDVPAADAVATAARALVKAGHDLLHDAREEPWGQTVARLQSPEGAIIGISYTPALHE
jgi:hypothetical protein